jgi:two-component system phosphate regulon sensor histidine kinase PhoR
MNLYLVRLLFAVLVMTVLALIGYLAGRPLGLGVWGAWLGACFGVMVPILRDMVRSERLMRWLRDVHSSATTVEAAPRDRGVWGELGYRIERSLRQREALLTREQSRLDQFLSAIDVSPNGVLLLDADFHIVWCNAAAADHFFLDPVRDLQQRVTNLLRAPAFVAYLQGDDYREPLSMLAPSGGLHLTVLIRAYGDGMRLVLSQDVTERLRAESMRRDFVANVSHEIRTPITVLAGFVETLANLPLTEAERHRVLTLMEQQTRRVQTLVADLLTLAQLEGSPRPTADRWVPVAELLEQVETEARGLSNGRHELLFPDIERAPLGTLQLAGYQTELVSALANLVSNAVRYTPAGGQVEVSGSVRGDGRFEFMVRDSGIGISREHLPRLTERFYRVDGSRSRETGGTGLGLSIVKHVVQRHGGELQIESEPGKGSCFRLVFPSVRVRQPVQALSAA